MQGKQSKNLVLEKAVDHVSEMNQKIELFEEYQQDRHALALENQALRKQMENIQMHNKELKELLETNNIPIPESFKLGNKQTSSVHSSTCSVTLNEEVPKTFSQAVGSENTCVTWSTSGKLPMTTTSVSSESNQPSSQTMNEDVAPLNLEGEQGVGTRSVQQSQSNYSLYTVSSIMNGLHQDIVSLVDSNVTQEAPQPSVSIEVPVETSVNGCHSFGTIPVSMTTNMGPQASGSVCVSEVNPVVGTQNVNTLGVAQMSGNQSLGSVCLVESGGVLDAAQGFGSGALSQSRVTTVPQGVAKVLLCQGPVVCNSRTSEITSVNVPLVVPQSFPATSVASNSGILIQSQPIMTLGIPTSCTPTLGVIGMNSKEVTPLITNGTSQNKTLQETVTFSNYVASVPTPGLTTNISSNQGPVTMAMCQPAALGTDNSRVISGTMLPQGMVTLGNNSTFNVNVPAKPTGVNSGNGTTLIHHQPQSLVTLNLSQPSLQSSCVTPSCATPMNSLITGTAPVVNLTPSPRTAFVIVRSIPSQQTANYSVPTQATPQPSYNSIKLRNSTSTRVTPSTAIQPTLYQNISTSGTIQTPFTLSYSSTPTPVVNTMPSTLNAGSGKRNHSTSTAQSKRRSKSTSSHPPAKLSKSGNPKKRPSSRSSYSSKSKATKQSKPNQRSVPSSAPNVCTTSGLTRFTNGAHAQQSSSSMDISHHEDMLSMQNFSISNLIPSIDSQALASVNEKRSSPLNTRIPSNEARSSGGSTTQPKPSQHSSSIRLSHSIDSLTGRTNVVLGQNQSSSQHQSNVLNFSAESLLGSGEDLVPNIQPITCANAGNNYNTHNTFSISAFQDSTSDGPMNQGFSNFSAEALISESDLIGISNESQSTRSNFTQGTQSGKQTHNRTNQMFSDFSAESLINSSDLGSGLSYAIENLISRSDTNDNSIAMASVNPNLIHSATSGGLQDNVNHPMYTPNTAMPVTPMMKNHSLASNYQNNTPGETNSFNSINLSSFSKYGFSGSPTKQPKETLMYKPTGNGPLLTYPASSVTTSPTFLKHSVDSITGSQHNAVSTGTGVFFSSPLSNNVSCPAFNSLYSLDQINPQPFQVGGNSYSLSGNLNRTFQGPTMGSFA